MITIYESKKEESQLPVKEKQPQEPIKVTKKLKKPKGKLNYYTSEFLEEYEEVISSEADHIEGNIKVSEVLSGVARLYEKLRTTVEYKGEHLLRRNAIERIIRRLAWEKGGLRANVDTKKISETLLKELIWARYLPNDSLALIKKKEVEKVLSKYFYLLNNIDSLPKEVSLSKAKSWIWGVASSELEDLLDPSNRDLYVKLMYDWFINYFDWKDAQLDEHEKNIQIFLAIHRAFPKSDDPIMRYHLLLSEFPDWQNAGKEDVNKFIINFPRLFNEIESHLNFRDRFAIYRKIKKHAAAFEILKTIADEEGMGFRKILLKSKKLEEKIRDVCDIKYHQIRNRVNRGIVRSIVYIFVTKVVFALLLEVPYEVIRYGEVLYVPLSINIIFPSLMMFIIGITIKTPGARNTEILLRRIKSIVYRSEEKRKHPFSIRRSKGKSTIVGMFSLFYALLFVLVFGGISYLLTLIGYTFFGIMVFFVFLSLVLLFVFRVRYQAGQLRIETEREGILNSLFNFITLPFINLGFYLSRGLAQLNFFTIILDFIIEAPLKSVIEIFEEWMSYIREKREDVIEVPE